MVNEFKGVRKSRDPAESDKAGRRVFGDAPQRDGVSLVLRALRARIGDAVDAGASQIFIADPRIEPEIRSEVGGVETD